MKIVELLNKIALPLTNEEADLLREFDENPIVSKSDLDPRKQLLANQLVTKDVLYRLRENGKIIFKKKIR